MPDNNITIEAAVPEKYELRPCDAPDSSYHRKPLYPSSMVDIEHDEALSDYGGVWATYKLYLRRDVQWYEVWHYAFHRTNGMGGSYGHAWEWKHVTCP